MKEEMRSVLELFDELMAAGEQKVVCAAKLQAAQTGWTAAALRVEELRTEIMTRLQAAGESLS